MQIKVIFDKNVSSSDICAGWGLSFLIDNRVLFDTGPRESCFLSNIEALGVDIDELEAVVISHEHWDHEGGLPAVLKRNNRLKVYACPGFSREFKRRVRSYGAELVEADKVVSICKDVWSTGELPGLYIFRYLPEQSLVLKTQKGLTIMTGCAHPGIVKIIEYVKQNIPGNIHLVLGGYHLMDRPKMVIASIVRKFKRLGVERAAPSHCSGQNAIMLFRREYGSNFSEVKVGGIIEI
ncbi:MAG: MBL fold metallo-hydrolase [Candidatus Omnitrophica bacterium]|nr:MBL fold metallo-hydrolase [Candidatus Omnitrophota bacterium]